MYKKVSTKMDFVQNELEVLEFWKKQDIFKKSLNKNKGKQVFSFYEGPPTANGMPHIGHLLTRTMKDIVPRYKTMKGYYVPRMAGWDTHGLPVELEVEKAIGSNGKQDIEKFGVDKFISLCKESVWKYKKIWEDMTERFGYWVDMDKPYITYENDYIESIFWAFKEMDKKGLIYKGHKVIPYCPRCGTSLSKMEVEKNYKDLKEKSIFVKFKSKEEKNTSFLVWTTTPWTLPSNIALCLNPKEIYVKLESGSENYIMLKALVPKLFEDGSYKILSEKTGKDYEFHKYEPLFDYYKGEIDGGYIVTVDEFVTLEDGTGIVHIAPAFGAEDYEVGRKYKLPFIQMINDDGKFIDKATEFKGMHAKQSDKLIIEKLLKENKLFKILAFDHSYPHCWRCETPLLYYAKDAWFIETTKIKDNMIKNNEEVYWLPDNIKKGRMGNFLENNIDWGISRNRYWGTPLPFWECENGHIHVVGSVKELRELSGFKGELDLHKPTLDKITFACPKCGKTMKRTPEVLDCWFDSGSMPFAQYHYPFENKELFEKTFPADFICEGIDQTRGWFYTLQAVNTILFNKTPYKSCTALGLVNDKFGQKMSKSKGNGVEPWSILNKQGTDAARWYFYYSCNPGQSVSFNEDGLVELQRRFLGTLWNVYAFYILYADIDKFNPYDYKLKDCKLAFIDKWLLSEYNALVKYVTEKLDEYNMLDSSRKITEFVDILSNWYIRSSRERFWVGGESEDKTAAFKTLHEILSGLIKLIAPFVPFITDYIYQNLVRSVNKTAPESVHLCEYPVTDEGLIDISLNEGMKEVLQIVALGRTARNAATIKNRQPLGSMYVCTANKLHLDDELKNLIMGELNVENLKIMHDSTEYVSYELKPQFRVLGPKYGPLLNNIKDELAKLDPIASVKTLNAGQKITISVSGQSIELAKDDVLINVINKQGFASESDGQITVVLDTHLSQDLLDKGIVRELVSKIQNFRKDSGLEVVNHIKIEYTGDPELEEIVKKHSKNIKTDTLCDKLQKGTDGDYSNTFDVDGKKLTVYISVIKQ